MFAVREAYKNVRLVSVGDEHVGPAARAQLRSLQLRHHSANTATALTPACDLLQFSRDPLDALDERRVLVRRGSAHWRNPRIGQEHKGVCVDEVRHQSREIVVVTDTCASDLVDGNGVVLVDDGNDAQFQ